MTQPRALVFDLDQTLFDRRDAFERWISSQTLSFVDQSRLRELDQNGDGDRDRLFSAFRSMKGEAIDQPGFVFALTRFVAPDDQLLQLLRRLRSQYQLAILTNGGVDSQLAKIRALLLDEVFLPERIYVSAEIGYAKPDRNAFQFVANSLGVVGRECVYFGDSWETDIHSARAAGWSGRQVIGPSELKRCLLRFDRANAC